MVSIRRFGTDPLKADDLIANSTITYSPLPDFNGPDSFTYTLDDGAGGTATGTVAVTVNPINDAPVAAGDAHSVDANDTLVIDAVAGVLENDDDADDDEEACLARRHVVRLPNSPSGRTMSIASRIT